MSRRSHLTCKYRVSRYPPLSIHLKRKRETKKIKASQGEK